MSPKVAKDNRFKACKRDIAYLLHCNVQGTISNTRESDAKYFTPLIIDASGFAMARLLKTKDESASALKKRIVEMEKITTRSVNG